MDYLPDTDKESEVKSSFIAFVLLSIMMLYSVSAYCSLAAYSIVQTGGKDNEHANPKKNFKPVSDTSYPDATSNAELLSANSRPLRLPNDLQAVLISGSTSVSPETSNQYSVIVRNRGSNPQTDYLVKLFNSAQTELASVPGPALTPGQFATVNLSFVAPPAGSFSIYGKVVFSGDQNNLNDQTTPLEIYIIQSTDYIVQIGSGTASQRQPFAACYGYERNASLYTQEQAEFVGQQLVNLAWYCSTTSTTPVPYKIYLKTITDSILTPTPWAIMIAGAQLVAEGTKTFDHLGWVNFSLNGFWQYMGGNLVVMVETYYGGAGASQYPQFYKSIGAIGSQQYWYNNNTPPTSNGIVTASLPNIVLDFWREIGPLPFHLTPSTCTFNLRKINTVSERTHTITFSGGGPTPMIINSITLTGSPMFSLMNLPTLPFSLAGMQSCNFTVRYNPTETGTHIAQITINTNFDSMYILHSNLSGSCIDPTIDTLPYVENFDNVTAPEVPVNWTKATISPGTVTTSTSSPYSSPNSAYLNNSSTSDGPYLISPQLASTISISTMRVRFRAIGNPNSVLSVGVLSDPANTDTYIQTTNLNLDTTWREFIVSFRDYAGIGHNIAFKYSNAATFQHIRIDDISIEAIPQNDLAATLISGTLTPTLAMTVSHSITIFNYGINAQSDYLVKLYKEGNFELASAIGPLINPGCSAQIVLSWTPSVSGVSYIYGKVILPGDENNLNDQTPNRNLNIFPPGTFAVTVGDGSQTASMPLHFNNKTSLTETIYLSSEVSIYGLITGMVIFNDFVDNPLNKPTKIWMGTTAQADLSSGWIPSSQLTSVFDGTVNYPEGQNAILINFPLPFLYLQDNLVVMFNRPMDSTYYVYPNNFLCQTTSTARTRDAYSLNTTLDPTSPPVAGVTVTGQYPMAGFLFLTGMPDFIGYVYDSNNVPLANVTVQILNGGQAITNTQGHYEIHNIFPGTYQITASKPEYQSQTVTVTFSNDIWPSQNFYLTQLPQVSVSGRVVGNDATDTGISGATFTLSGTYNYSAATDNLGYFTLPDIYTGQEYNYHIDAAGYHGTTGTITVSTTDINMGTIILNEIAYPPLNVTAVLNNTHTGVILSWLAPDPSAVEISQSFEDTLFPPSDWTRIVTDNHPAMLNGVYPTWCRFGTVVDVITTVAPHDGLWQCGFWYDYNHQDEWLLTPQFMCSSNTQLTFWSYVYLGSINGDHYYVKISTDNGLHWTVLWDASALTGGWNNYQTPIAIDLSDYAGQQVKIAWHADDNNNEGMWYNWFIDDVVIRNNYDTIRFADTEINAKSSDATSVVKTNKSISKTDVKKSTGLSVKPDKINRSARNDRMLMGYKVWRLLQGQQQNESTWIQITPYTILASQYTDANTIITENMIWAVKAVYTGNVLSPAAFSNAVTIPPTPNDDEIMIEDTILHANYPNPFNPETTICYDLKEKSPIRIDIYNIKGQLIKILVNEAKSAGSYKVVWNGKDSNGKEVSSGIYQYRMQAGEYHITRRMMLLK